MNIQTLKSLDIRDEEGQDLAFYRSARDEWTDEGGDVWDQKDINTMIYSGAWTVVRSN